MAWCCIRFSFLLHRYGFLSSQLWTSMTKFSIICLTFKILSYNTWNTFVQVSEFYPTRIGNVLYRLSYFIDFYLSLVCRIIRKDQAKTFNLLYKTTRALRLNQASAARSMILSTCSSEKKKVQYFRKTLLLTVLMNMLNFIDVRIKFWWEKTFSTTAFCTGASK